METFRGTDLELPSYGQLSKLYCDAKAIYNTLFSSTSDDEGSEIGSMHQKLRIQKDRLVAWGLEWSDDNAHQKGSIDTAIERAGFTELVQSVMENIKDVLDETDKIRKGNYQVPAGYPPEKGSIQRRPNREWSAAEKAHYNNAIKDLTGAIDTLCDLSRSRRESRTTASAPDTDPMRNSTSDRKPDDVEWTTQQPQSHDYHGSYLAPHQASSELAHIPQIPQSLLRLPAEQPPPYGRIATASRPRVFGRLGAIKAAGLDKHDAHEADVLPVMVEYENFDTVFRETVVHLPMVRLEQLYHLLQDRIMKPPPCFLKLLGYFEDTKQARIGLIYQLPRSSVNSRDFGPSPSPKVQTLLQVLQNASKLHPSPNTSATMGVPALEDKFRLAIELTLGYRYLLEQDFPHRNVHSSNVMLFGEDTGHSETRLQIRKPFLCAFDLFSEHNVESSPEFLHENIYRHPNDPRVKGPTSAQEYYPEYDLYSLGLVLLEIGLWTPLADMFKEKYSLRDFKTRIEKIWVRRLASKCGTVYMHAVQECLTAGDHVSKLRDNLGPLYERIVHKLQRCCLLDEAADHVHERQASEVFLGAPSDVAAFHQRESVIDQGSDTGFQQRSLAPSNVADQQNRPQRQFSSGHDTIDANVASTHGLVTEAASPRVVPAETRGVKPVQTSIQIFPDMILSMDILKQWDVIGDQLARSVTRALRHSKESFSVDILGVGEHEATARPTLCVMCKSTKRVRSFLRKNFFYDTHAFDLIVLDGRVVRSKLPASENTGRLSDVRENTRKPQNPFHHTRPLCGASIGAWKNEEHLSPVSFGGVVMVDGRPFGMSVHHLLEEAEADSETDAPTRSAGSRSIGGKTSHVNSRSATLTVVPANLAVVDLAVEADDLTDWIVSDDSPAESSADDDLSDADDSDADTSNGDVPGVSLGTGDHIKVTQPALDDVDRSFFPSEQDRDEDHLDSHFLGTIHASSGLRRQLYRGTEQEMDWALITLEDDRLQPHNIIAGGRRFCSNGGAKRTPKVREPVCRHNHAARDDFFPTDIATSDQISGLSVHSSGRTSGLETGRITQAMQLVRLPGRQTYSRSWCVTGNFGMGGDSGAWVVDNEFGRVCGHVLAYNQRLARAYISPMDMMFEDMKKSLGAQQVHLLGASDCCEATTQTLLEVGAQHVVPGLKALSVADASHRGHDRVRDRLRQRWSARSSVVGQAAS